MLLCMMLALPGCTTPAEQNKQFAQDNDLQRHLVRGEGFYHVVYFNQAALTSASNWHVYIEGDGRPWINHRFLATDPTAPKPLMLRLMSQDRYASIYIGRPCYEGTVTQAECTPWVYSQGRYSNAVVKSMIKALDATISQHHVRSITLIGHSGGGTLVMLMAPAFPEINKLMTISGNLDTDAWVKKHDYSPLSGSLNPANSPPLHRNIEQHHFLGKKDRNIPLSAVLAVLKNQPNAKVSIVANCGHTDCWEKLLVKALYSQVN